MVMRLMAVLRAQVRSIISSKLPNSMMVREMEMAPETVPPPSIPVMGAIKMSQRPWGLLSTT